MTRVAPLGFRYLASMRKTIAVHGGREAGGYDIQVLDTPGKVTYETGGFESFKLHDCQMWHGYVSAAEIHKKLLPLEANPRMPQPSGVVRAMIKTIQHEPEKFFLWNNGITILARSCKYDEHSKAMTLTFGSKSTNTNHGDGICNGGHTYFAITSFPAAPDDECWVKVEVVVLPQDLEEDARGVEIMRLAEKRNAHNQLKSSTTANFSGHYSDFKDVLGPKSILIRWFEGDPEAIAGAIDVKRFVAMLTGMSPAWFDHPLGSSPGIHKTAARNVGSSHDRWARAMDDDDQEEKRLSELLFLTSDILDLTDQISYDLLRDNQTDWSGVSSRFWGTRLGQYFREHSSFDLRFNDSLGGHQGLNMPHTAMTLLVGSMRGNVWMAHDEDGAQFVGWLLEPMQLWKDSRVGLMRSLLGVASGITNNFGNTFFATDAVYRHDLAMDSIGRINLATYLVAPEVLIDDSGVRFKKVGDLNNATHFLEAEYDASLNCVTILKWGINTTSSVGYVRD